MARSPPVSGSLPAPGPSNASRAQAAQPLQGDSVLRIAFLAAGLLLGYQLAVTLLHPPWIGPVTDWLQALLAWSGLLVVGLVSRWLTHHQSRLASSWWLMGAGLLSYALARTLWLVQDLVLSPHHAPSPSWTDLFFFLQYPCYLLALLLLPRASHQVRRVLLVVDTCLLIGAALALSWYFLLAPIYLSSHESWLGKLVNLGYPVGDLALLFGLMVLLLRYHEYVLERAILALLIAGSVCLVVADTWNAYLLLNRSNYQAGSPPDLFWMAFYLLVPLASLVRFRFEQQASAGVSAGQISQQPTDLWRHDLLVSLRVTFPVAVTLLACLVILIRAQLGIQSVLPRPMPFLIALFLLGLALTRQGLMVMENERGRREREQALREMETQMEAFLGIAGHELKNPLASMRIGLQLADRRIRRLLQRERVEVTDVAPLLEPVVQAEYQEERLDRLVNDLVDIARIRAGKLELHLASTDLTTIVREAVEEQRQINPERTVLLECPGEPRVPILADAQRLGQVVTNYLSNALKYSAADRPVVVGLAAEGHQARVWVRDEGPGMSAEDQQRIWERFHQVPGIEIQSGTGVGLGLGLPICRTIMEHHQGQVGVQSSPGQGSTFWFSLPLGTSKLALEESQAGASEG